MSVTSHNNQGIWKGTFNAKLLLLLLAGGLMFWHSTAVAADGNNSTENVSLRHEVQRAIDRGLSWLEAHQKPGGYWSDEDHPAITALVLSGFQRNPDKEERDSADEVIDKGYDYLMECVQPDGGIYNKPALFNYNTAIGVMALLAADNPQYDPIIRRARQFLVNMQFDKGTQGKLDHPMDGGVGYGSSPDHSDMSNTLFALEALYHSRYLKQDSQSANTAELNWDAAIQFIENCQNLPKYNEQAWASGDAQNRGGFVYRPGESKAGKMTLDSDSGRTALRSYGSMSYAGLLSYIYADLDRGDPRVQAVLNWLKRNYTLEENPGMGQEGLYYYYHTMTKALTVYGLKRLKTADGDVVNWRKALALELFNRQREDGSWVNDNGRWWENDPALVTAYVVLSLDMIHEGLQ